MSTRNDILAAVASAFDGLAEGRVYRERKEQLPGVPAIVITPGDEQAEERLLGVMDAELQINVELYVRGETASATADDLLLSVHAAITADLTLGLGSDVQVLPRRSVRWDQENYDEARVTVTYTVFYRTSFGGM